MADRFSPAYIDLCRKLALPREWLEGEWLEGDWYDIEDDFGGGATILWRDDLWIPPRVVWLPTEGDLLDLLEAEGGHHVEIIGMDDHSYTCTLFRLDDDGEPNRSWTYEGAPDDRKLALLRLYATVKGIDLA